MFLWIKSFRIFDSFLISKSSSVESFVIFIAKNVPKNFYLANNTVPYPPLPISDTISYSWKIILASKS